MSKKICAALLAVFMVITMLPMAAGATETTPTSVVPANLTYAEGKDAPAYGHIDEGGTYTTELSEANGVKTITITAYGVQKTTNPAS